MQWQLQCIVQAARAPGSRSNCLPWCQAWLLGCQALGQTTTVRLRVSTLEQNCQNKY